MTDGNRDLRTRIAAVLHRELSPPCCDECHDWGPEPWEIDLADAVIAELGLPPHWGRPTFDNGDTCELTDSGPANRPTESAQ